MSKSRPLEKDIENAILKHLHAMGIFAWKNQSTGVFDPSSGLWRASNNPFHINGVSDILGILPDGRFLAIEVKRPLKKKIRTQEDYFKASDSTVSPEQKAFIRKINSLGGVGFFADNIDTVSNYLAVHLPKVEIQ